MNVETEKEQRNKKHRSPFNRIRFQNEKYTKRFIILIDVSITLLVEHLFYLIFSVLVHFYISCHFLCQFWPIFRISRKWWKYNTKANCENENYIQKLPADKSSLINASIFKIRSSTYGSFNKCNSISQTTDRFLWKFHQSHILNLTSTKFKGKHHHTHSHSPTNKHHLHRRRRSVVTEINWFNFTDFSPNWILFYTNNE